MSRRKVKLYVLQDAYVLLYGNLWFECFNLSAIRFAGYKTLEVVKSNQDAYIHTTRIKKWDICAGNAILNALDGKMTTLDGKHIDYKSGDQAVNEAGLLATTYNHDLYLSKLKDLKNIR